MTTTFKQVLLLDDDTREEDALKAYWDNQPYYWATVTAGDFLNDFDEAYEGEFDSEEDFGQSLADDLGVVPSSGAGATYFDYGAWTRDLFLGDYWSDRAPGGGVFVFRSI